MVCQNKFTSFMVSEVKSVTYSGVEAITVRVEVHFAQGLPAFTIVGLPDKTVAESRERVKAAFHSLGLALPQKRITVNLAPADLLKEGSHFDLAIAIGMMLETKIIEPDKVADYVVIGELSLNGKINSVNGVLPAAIVANANDCGIICPYDNYKEAYYSGNSNILAPNNLFDIINFFKDRQVIPTPSHVANNDIAADIKDMADVKGQGLAKRALEIAAAGGHNMLMVGPPGSGKSMLAKRIVGLLPEMSTKQKLEVSSIYSISGQGVESGIVTDRPYRAPHSSASMPAMIGGGRTAKPGEITLANHGVLFMDELPEYHKNVLESMRQPLESNKVTIARVNSHVTYPANFQLIAAMNPCKCGYYGDATRSCTKAPRCAEDYQSRISGPLLDRFDLQVEVPAFNPFLQNNIDIKEESSTTIAKRVAHARSIQTERFKSDEMVELNSQLDGNLLSLHVQIDDKSTAALKGAAERFKLSMRGINRILRVARTIADIAKSADVKYEHLVEAIGYRS